MSIEEKAQYMVDINDYQIVKQINKGGFGIIYLVKNKNTFKELAAKVNLIDISSSQSVSMQQMVYRELSILIRAHHPTIIQFRGFSPIDFNKNENMVIFMDYMKNGSLEYLLNQSRKGLCNSIYNNTIRQIILAGIARGMMYLHSQNIIHRDLKPGNVLLDDNFYPHITDFGLSKFFDPQNTKNQSKVNCGTTVYMAPEVIQDDSYNTKADVYAFAVIMYEVISGQPAFPQYISGEKNDYQIKSDVIKGKRPTFDNVPIKSSFRRLIEKCWSQNPSERPEFSELFEKLSTYKETQPESSKIDENDDDNYCLEDVDSEIFLDYIDSITHEDKTSENNEDNREIMKLLKKQEEAINLMKNHISSLENEITSLKKKNEEFESKFQESRVKIDSSYARCFGKSYEAKLNLKDQGILAYLKAQEKSKFDRLFIPSQSSNDIYNIIDPNSKDLYCSGSFGNFYVEFQLKEEITIVGIKIKSSIFCFPKSFDVLINNETVVSTKHADGLNGANKEFTFEIPSKRGNVIRIKQTGGNWDKEGQEQNFFSLKNVELYSSDIKYKSKGVFEQMIEESPNKNSHDCGVFIDAQNIAFDTFFNLNSNERSINTHNKKESYFQVEIKKGAVIINGFRLKRTNLRKMKTFMILATDNQNKPLEKWSVLFDINETTLNDHQILDIYQTEMSQPARFIRLVQTGLNWTADRFLQFFHFDIFGYYIDNIDFKIYYIIDQLVI